MIKSLATDSSTLIILSKLNYLDKALEFFEEIEVPLGVLREIELKDDEVKRKIRELLDSKRLKREDIDVEFPFLGRGESSAIRLALDKSKVLCLDDKKARRLASDLGLTVIGTLSILRKIYKIGELKERPEELYFKLKALGFYMDYALFIKIFA
jgi:predicted nucleic acid-binding protein